MKSTFSFILCSVLIYATIYCSNAATEEMSPDLNEPRADDETCAVDYFKRKGKLPENYEWFKPSPLCSETMDKTLRDFKGGITGLLQDTLPTKLDCIMGQFEKNETIDVLLKIATIIGNRYGGVHSDLLKAARDEATEQLKAAATACELEDETLLSNFKDLLTKPTGSLSAYENN